MERCWCEPPAEVTKAAHWAVVQGPGVGGGNLPRDNLDGDDFGRGHPLEF